MLAAILTCAALAAIVIYVLGATWTCTDREERGPRVYRRWKNALWTRHECWAWADMPSVWTDAETGDVSFLSEAAADLERAHREAGDE